MSPVPANRRVPEPGPDPIGAWLEAFPLQCRLVAGGEPRAVRADGARVDLRMTGVRVRASLAVDGAPPRALEPGAVVFARPDARLTLRAHEPLADPDAQWVIAVVTFAGAGAEAWARRVPAVLLAPADSARHALLERLARERDAASAGASLQTRLAVRWLLVEAVRAWLDTEGERGRRALVDPVVAAAVRALAAAPADDWSLERLARAVPCSRTVLVERFTRALGVSPMRHLLDLRMRRASELLGDPGLGLKHIATAVGYSNEASFGAAYKRWAGKPPGAMRADEGRERAGAAATGPRPAAGEPPAVRRARPRTSPPSPTPSTS